MFSKKKITIYLLGLISLGLLFIIPSQIKADTGVYDFFYYNWQKGLGYFNTGVSQWLIGGTATTTSQAKLQVLGGFQSTNSTSTNSSASNIFCINNTTPDCISAWPSGIQNWVFSGATAITPSTTIGILVNASSTFSNILNVRNKINIPNSYGTPYLIYQDNDSARNSGLALYSPDGYANLFLKGTSGSGDGGAIYFTSSLGTTSTINYFNSDLNISAPDEIKLTSSNFFIDFDYPAFYPQNSNITLGTSGNPWATAYLTTGNITTANITTSTISTSLAIPNGSNPLLITEGGLCSDSTVNQLLYYSGAKINVLTATSTKCAVIENLIDTDDDISLGHLPVAATIKELACSYLGTGTTKADIQLEDGSGNIMTHASTTCAADGTAPTPQLVTANNTLTAWEKLRMRVVNTPDPTSDDYTICVTYTYDRQ